VHISKIKTVIAVAAVGLLSAVGAASASALPATWVGGNSPGVKATGTLTVKVGAQTTTCVYNPAFMDAVNSGAPLQGRLLSNGASSAGCANGGAFSAGFNAPASKNAGVFTINSTTGGGVGGRNPFGPYGSTYNAIAWSAPAAWVNGAGAVPSKLTFNNTTIGFASTSPGGNVIITGTLNITKNNNTLLTLQ
jgi:hypothetical protein